MTLGLRQARTAANVIAEHLCPRRFAFSNCGHILSASRRGYLGGSASVWRSGALSCATRGVLFDEPLSNLDAALRSQMRFEISDSHRRLKSTIVYVTHDQIEALTLADRIVVVNAGVVQQVGTPPNFTGLQRTPLLRPSLARSA
jgi:multiple sugar transport system ATP-binding protein